MKAFSQILLLVLVIVSFTSSKKVCLSPEGSEVDWYVILLYPQTSVGGDTIIYSYFDNNQTELKYYKFAEDTFPGLKVVGEYEGDKTNHFFWNDDVTKEGEKKKSSSNGKAHSKGGLIFDAHSAVLLSHSLPRFPTRTADERVVGSLPSNAGIYGQHFICISMDTDNALKVVESLNIINPSLIIQSETDSVFNPASSVVEKLIKNRQDSKLEKQKTFTIKSQAGNVFTIFTKSKNEEDLPYDAAIPTHYQDGLYVEAWTKPDLIESNCGEFDILNVVTVKMGNIKYDQNQEHSKWAVGLNKNFVCFGDLNRTESQKERAGNTICFENETLAGILRGSVAEYEPCPKKKGKKKNLQFLQD
jgi:deoxyribonuclease-2